MNWRPKPGEKNPNAKLTLEEVREIRRLAREGRKRKELADIFGVALRTVSSIVKGEHWREDGSPYIPNLKW